MSKADFEERLRRIGAAAPQEAAASPPTDPAPAAAPAAPPPRKRHRPMVGLGGVIVAFGVHLTLSAWRAYTATPDHAVTDAVLGLGLGGAALLLAGTLVILRTGRRVLAPTTKAAPASDPASDPAADTIPPARRRRSPILRLVLSLVGLAMGAAAYVELFVAQAARGIDTEHAAKLAEGGALTALALACVAFLVGLSALARRSRSLMRVPVYFLLGGVLCFSAYRIAQIDTSEVALMVADLQ